MTKRNDLPGGAKPDELGDTPGPPETNSDPGEPLRTVYYWSSTDGEYGHYDTDGNGRVLCVVDGCEPVRRYGRTAQEWYEVRRTREPRRAKDGTSRHDYHKARTATMLERQTRIADLLESTTGLERREVARIISATYDKCSNATAGHDLRKLQARGVVECRVSTRHSELGNKVYVWTYTGNGRK